MSALLMDDKQLLMNRKTVVGIFSGSDIQGKTVKRIENLMSKASCQDIDCKVVLYDEMKAIITVLILARHDI